MVFTMWALGALGAIQVAGLIFTRLHPDFQGGAMGMPNRTNNDDQSSAG